jgi:integrase
VALGGFSNCGYRSSLARGRRRLRARSPDRGSTGFARLLYAGSRSNASFAAVLKKKVQPAFAKVGIIGVGWHTFRHTVGTMLAEMGEHQLTIRDYLRHSNLHVTNKYLQTTSQSKRLAQGKLVDAILPGGVLSASKSTLIQ